MKFRSSTHSLTSCEPTYTDHDHSIIKLATRKAVFQDITKPPTKGVSEEKHAGITLHVYVMCHIHIRTVDPSSQFDNPSLLVEQSRDAKNPLG